ncbi:hypothetical protein GH714_032612 [Hevea brasiliensis]|uniref:Uncharacterized protein n=1 Tax=Hevea brasiliensis TaxID=3981 RepID=A0A6A6LKV8_HEVBR|nr:hypothetical protein GH714_032612 [Hevea brasiliensis]
MEAFKLSGDDSLNVAISYNSNDGDATVVQEEMSLEDELEEMVKELNVLLTYHDRYNVANIDFDMSHIKFSPSIKQAPKLELKPFT